MSKPTGKKNEVRAILPRPLVLHPGFKKDPGLLRMEQQSHMEKLSQDQNSKQGKAVDGSRELSSKDLECGNTPQMGQL